MKLSEKNDGLGELMERGGIYYNIEGSVPREVLSGLVSVLPPHRFVSPELLLQAVLEREALMSTSIGSGIALPHPRNPLVNDTREQFASLAFLKQPVDWNSLDRKPVDTLLLIVSASAKLHLRTLSTITFFCRQEGFQKLIRERAPAEEIIRFIKDAEREWK